MRNILTAGGLLAATLAVSFAHAGALPESGRSAFDVAIERSGGVVPYPYERLAELFAGGRASEAGVHFPAGRSVQRSAANAKHPRALLRGIPAGDRNASPTALLDRTPDHLTFVGYSEEEKRLEVISWNDALGRFEFQVVRDYGAGLTPRVEYAQRGMCITCHQNEGPMFPEGPWKETGAAAFPGDTRSSVYGIALPRPGDMAHPNASGYDAAVRESDRLLRFRRAWTQGCSGDPATAAECRTQLLLAAVRKTARAAACSSDERTREALAAAFPDGGLAHPGYSIPDRDPREASYLGGPLDPMVRRATTRQTDPLASLDDAGAFLGGAVGARAIDRAARGDCARLESALRSPAVQEFLRSGRFSRNELLRLVLGALGEDTGAAGWDRQPFSSPGVLPHGIIEYERSAGHTETTCGGETISPLEVLRRNCSGCHVGNGVPALDFMETADDGELARRLRSNPEVLRRMEWSTTSAGEQMPPVASRHGRQMRESGCTDHERALAWLRAGVVEQTVSALDSVQHYAMPLCD